MRPSRAILTSSAFLRPQRAGISTKNPLVRALEAISPAARITGPRNDAYHKIIREAVTFSQDRERSADPILNTDTEGSLSLDVIMAALRTIAFIDDATMDHLGKLIRSLLLYSDSNLNSSALFEALTAYTSQPDLPEQHIFVISQMLERNLTPSIELIENTIRSCCEWGMPRLALELAERIEQSSVQRISTSSWVEILMSSVERHFVEGVDIAWTTACRSQSFRPDEGIINRTLNVAARWGRPDLASRALASLSDLGATAQEHHFAALLESYVNAGQVPEAFRVVSLIKANGISTSITTVEPIADVMTSSEIIDQAFYGLEDMQKSGEVIDVSSVNALILASARLGDLRRARATQTAMGDLGVAPNVETFDLILEACTVARHRPLGDTVLSEMAAADIAPAASTYERLIQLCLIADEYDDAFYYLEKMKGEGHIPSAAAYDAILRRCLQSRDTRWHLVREEMKSLGYSLDITTRRMLRD